MASPQETGPHHTWLTAHIPNGAGWIPVPWQDRALFMRDSPLQTRNHWVSVEHSGPIESVTGRIYKPGSEASDLVSLITGQRGAAKPESIAYYTRYRIIPDLQSEHIINEVSVQRHLFALDAKGMERGMFFVELRAVRKQFGLRKEPHWALRYVVPVIRNFAQQHKAYVVDVSPVSHGRVWTADCHYDQVKDGIMFVRSASALPIAKMEDSGRAILLNLMDAAFDTEITKPDDFEGPDAVGEALVQCAVFTLAV